MGPAKWLGAVQEALLDLDTDGEDHAIDDARYACLSRPFLQRVIKYEDKNPYLVSNAFRLAELRD